MEKDNNVKHLQTSPQRNYRLPILFQGCKNYKRYRLKKSLNTCLKKIKQLGELTGGNTEE